MANFREHLIAGTVLGGFGATSLLVAGHADPQAVLLYLVAAIIGGVLPDIDADNSTPLHLAFTFFAVLFAFLAMFGLVAQFSIAELLILWVAIYLFFKLAVFALFVRMTVHRGVFHSLPAGVLFIFLTTIALSKLFHFPDKVAWLAGGGFVGLGYLVHLLLDELFSLNLFGQGGVKHSLGSALKLYSMDWKATIALYAVTVGLFFLTPGLSDIFPGTFNAKTGQVIQERLLPKAGWFTTGVGVGAGPL